MKTKQQIIKITNNNPRPALPFRGLGLCILLFAKLSTAQDFHLSQYDANPLYLNPALTGLRLNEDWNYRFNLNYREQRSNSGGSYKTVASGFDMPLDKRFSIGEFVINNKGVNSGINTFNLMLSGAYKIIHSNPNGNDRHNLSVGLQVGLLQRSLNNGNFVYDAQYSPSASNGFDANLPSEENFVRQSTFNFDMNMGVYYRFVDKNKKYSPFGGFSIYHLSQPNQAYTDINSQTPMRFTLHGGCAYTINEEISILPQFMYMNQAKAHELNIGIMGFDKIRCTDYQPMLGLSWRVQNAVTAHLGLKYKTYTFRVSYDIYTYYLKQYGNRGLELSFVFTPKKLKSTPDLIAVLLINPETTVIPVDSSTKILPIIKDSATSVLPKEIIHDTIKSVISVDSSIKQLPIIKDSATSVLPKKNIHDTTVVPMKLVDTISQAVKDSAVAIVSKIPFDSDSLFLKVSYRVQLGAFKEEVPLEIANKLLTVRAKKIKNLKDKKDYTVFTVGDFATHDEAIDLKNEMIEKGFSDAFIMKISPDSTIVPIKH